MMIRYFGAPTAYGPDCQPLPAETVVDVLMQGQTYTTEMSVEEMINTGRVAVDRLTPRAYDLPMPAEAALKALFPAA